MAGPTTKVLYIAGWGRSGSTILTQILGQMEGYVSVGELWYIWERGFLENRHCGCGARFRDCPMWAAVLDKAFGGIDKVDPRRMLALQNSALRTRHMPLMLTEAGTRRLNARLGEYREHIERLYQAILEVNGARVIVDSSKVPTYAVMLSGLPAVELHLLHLIRDPRAVAFSWMRNKFDPDRQKQFATTSPGKSSVLWFVWNLGLELLMNRGVRRQRYQRLRYEDFVRQSEATIAAIRQALEEGGAAGQPVQQNQVFVERSHIIAGNPVRFESGVIKLKPDMEWKTKLKAHYRVLVTALTWPLLLKYRYPIRG
jgi:hypothetical protein